MNKSVEYYLAKGMDIQAAEYFASGRKTITAVKPNDDFSLTITFDNREKRLYDMRSFLKKGTIFEPFIDINNFRRVYLDSEHCISWDLDPTVDSSIVWNNKVDLCPDSCYMDSISINS